MNNHSEPPHKEAKEHDEVYVIESEKTFRKDYPRFRIEAISGYRVLIYVEPRYVWMKCKFVTPVRGHNELRSKILLQFLKESAKA